MTARNLDEPGAALAYLAENPNWKLILYARHRAIAEAERMGGSIDSALKHEKECDRIYQLLKPEEKW